MRQIYIHVLGVAVAVLTLASCDKEDAEPKSVRDYPTFSATIEGSATRAYDTTWESDDKIGIYGGGASNISHTHQGNGSFSVTTPTEQILFTDDSEVKFYAYYPHDKTGTSGNNLGKVYTYTTTNITQTPAKQKTFDYLWAEASGSKANPDVEFNFTHRMSKITLVFTSEEIDVSDITAYSVSGLYLRGTFDPLKGECKTTTTSTSSASVTVSNFGNDKVTEDVPAPPIIVFPQTLKSNPVTLTVTAADAGIGPITGTLNFPDGKLEFGNEYRFYITIRKTDITVNKSTITEWTRVDRGDSWEAW